MVQKVEPILGQETSSLVLWFIEVLIQTSSKQKYEIGIETEQEKRERLKEERLQKEKARQFNQNSKVFVAVHGEKAMNMVGNLMSKIPSSLSGGENSEDHLINYNDKKIISTDELQLLNKQHESNPTKYPQYFSTSETNSIKNTSNINSFLNTSWFVVEDGIEELDLSEDLESSCLLQEEMIKENLPKESMKSKDDRSKRYTIREGGPKSFRNNYKNNSSDYYHRHSQYIRNNRNNNATNNTNYNENVNTNYSHSTRHENREYSNKPNIWYYPSSSTTSHNNSSSNICANQPYSNINHYVNHAGDNTTNNQTENNIQQSSTYAYPQMTSCPSNSYNFDSSSSSKRTFDNYNNESTVHASNNDNKKRKYNNQSIYHQQL